MEITTKIWSFGVPIQACRWTCLRNFRRQVTYQYFWRDPRGLIFCRSAIRSHILCGDMDILENRTKLVANFGYFWIQFFEIRKCREKIKLRNGRPKMTPHDDSGSADLRFVVKFRINRLLHNIQNWHRIIRIIFDRIAETRGARALSLWIAVCDKEWHKAKTSPGVTGERVGHHYESSPPSKISVSSRYT